MIDAILQVLNDGGIHHFVVTRDGAPIPCADAFSLWQCDVSFRTFFNKLLSDSPFTAYRWETPPVTSTTNDRPFELVLHDCPELAARRSDSETYADYFTTDDADHGVVVFKSLRKDATLVVPSPRGANSNYGHLAAFVRGAPESQRHALWRVVGETMERQISERPLWLSTAGGGVAWLHVRVDTRPKYYRFDPYKKHK